MKVYNGGNMPRNESFALSRAMNNIRQDIFKNSSVQIDSGQSQPLSDMFSQTYLPDVNLLTTDAGAYGQYPRCPGKAFF
jgi:hypothetical protein